MYYGILYQIEAWLPMIFILDSNSSLHIVVNCTKITFVLVARDCPQETQGSFKMHQTYAQWQNDAPSRLSPGVWGIGFKRLYQLTCLPTIPVKESTGNSVYESRNILKGKPKFHPCGWLVQRQPHSQHPSVPFDIWRGETLGTTSILRWKINSIAALTNNSKMARLKSASINEISSFRAVLLLKPVGRFSFCWTRHWVVGEEKEGNEGKCLLILPGLSLATYSPLKVSFLLVPHPLKISIFSDVWWALIPRICGKMKLFFLWGGEG